MKSTDAPIADLGVITATSTPSIKITSIGAALGSLRLDVSEIATSWGAQAARTSATVRVCAPDEDSLTLAWLAGSQALLAAGYDPSSCSSEGALGLWWGTSRPPFAEGPSHSYLAAALSLPADAPGTLLSGSTHSGMDAFLTALDSIAAGTVSRALVVASDAPLPGTGTACERFTGSGAAAFLLEPAGDDLMADRADSLGQRAQTKTPSMPLVRWRAGASAPVLDRYRPEGQMMIADLYDQRLFREEILLPAVAAVGKALDTARQASEAKAGIDSWILPDPDGRLGRSAAKRLGARRALAESLFSTAGDTGAAACLLGLALVLGGAGDDIGDAKHITSEEGRITPESSDVEAIGTIAYGGGRASGIVVERPAVNVEQEPHSIPGAIGVRAAITQARKASYSEVLRSRDQLVAMSEPIPMGLPPGSAGFVRGTNEVLRCQGGQCAACGWVSIPPTIHPTCVNCGGTDLDIIALDRSGVVHTFVVNQTMPAPFTAPLPLVVIDLDSGSRIMVQGTADSAADLGIGQRTQLVLRRYALERGAPVYGFKACPETPIRQHPADHASQIPAPQVTGDDALKHESADTISGIAIQAVSNSSNEEIT